MHGTLPWYVARSSGLVAWSMLAASTLWGLFMTTRAFGRRVKPAWLLDLHRFLGGLAVIFTAVHVVALLGDRFVGFGITDVLVPLADRWRPGPTAWGIVALYLLVAVEVTSLARRRISTRAWRWTHALSFPLFVAATVHGVLGGSDGRRLMVDVTAGVVGLAFVFLSVARLEEVVES